MSPTPALISFWETAVAPRSRTSEQTVAACGPRIPSSSHSKPGPTTAAAAGPTVAGELALAGAPRRAEGLTESDVGNLNAVLEHEIARNTIDNYRSQWRIFSTWALKKGARALPAEATQVAAYLAERIEQHGHKPATLRVAAAAIAFAHRTAGLPDPCASAEVKRTLKGATRKAGRSQQQADALTAEAFARIQSAAHRQRRGRSDRLESPQTAVTRGNVDIALIGIMRDALLRASEAAALTWSDIQAERDGTGRLLIRRSKTDPEGHGAVAYVSAPTMAALQADTRRRRRRRQRVRPAPQPDLDADQAGGRRRGARRRLQRALAAGGDGAGPGESRHRTAQSDDRRTLANARDARAVRPQRDRQQGRRVTVLPRRPSNGLKPQDPCCCLPLSDSGVSPPCRNRHQEGPAPNP